MTYNFLTDFSEMKTTVYLYTEYTNNDGKLITLPLSRPMKEDKKLVDILWKDDFSWYFKNYKYGSNLRFVTRKARSYSHGSLEYNDIKMHLPGFTWCGTVNTKLEYDEESQDFIEKRCKRSNDTIELNGLICIEFDDIDSKDIEEYSQKALSQFDHIIYVGRTLSNKMFCIHRADKNLNKKNFDKYVEELCVQYYKNLGIKADTSCKDIARMRYLCAQNGGRSKMEYTDFCPSENVDKEYIDIFSDEPEQYIKRVRRNHNNERSSDESIYEYDKSKGFYYGHTKDHIMQIGDLEIAIPSIEKIINTLLAIGKTADEIIELWKNKLMYYNYNTNSDDISDNIKLTKKIAKDDRKFTIGKTTYEFLQMFFPEIFGIKSTILHRDEFLCDRFYDTLKDNILKYNRLLIHADTGIGKTFFANKLGEEMNVIVIVPYTAHMSNYSSYRQIEYEEVEKIDTKIKSAVIIWDRFIKLYHRGMIDEESIIIIDESHKIFLDQTYRGASITLRNIIKEIPNHICYISATPINEINVEKTLKFEKNRKKVDVYYTKIYPVENDIDVPIQNYTLEAMMHLIYGNLNYYDHIFIASNHYAQRIFDRLYGRYDCQLIRASEKDSQEYLDLMRDQLLKHKIIVGTCISYESLNFNNKNEKILTITDMNEETSAQSITQIAGRVRFSSNKVFLIETIQESNEEINFNDLADYYNKIEEIQKKYNLYYRKHYVQNAANEITTVHKWYKENNNIDSIKENLPLYINWKETEMNTNRLIDNSPLNSVVKEYIIDYISKPHNTRFDMVDLFVNDEYNATSMFFDDDDYIKITETGQAGYIIRERIREQQYSYQKMLSVIDASKLDKMISDGQTLLNGMNGKILRIMDIVKMDEQKFKQYINDLYTYCNSNECKFRKTILNTCKDIENIRKKFSECFNNDEYVVYKNIFDKILSSKINTRNVRKEAAKMGGKKSKKIKDLQTGIIYESCHDCAEAINHNVTYISKHKNRFIIVE